MSDDTAPTIAPDEIEADEEEDDQPYEPYNTLQRDQ